MPQMFPMNWIFLMFLTIFSIYIYISLIYFLGTNETTQKKFVGGKKLNWKW